MHRIDSQPQTERPVPETPVNALGVAEMFALWGIRLWVVAYRGGGNLLPDLRRGFVLAGAPAAWLDLDEFLTRLLGNVRRPLDIRPVASPLLSADELGALHWLAGLQRDDSPTPQCDRLRTIAAPGARLARALADAGLRFGSADADGGFAAHRAGDHLMQ